MNDGRPRPLPDPIGQPPTSGAVTDPIAPPVTGPIDGARFPDADAAKAKPIVVTKPMAAQPPRQQTQALGPAISGIGTIVKHRATQMAASVGVPSTLESPKDPMLLRAEAQTRIERPLGSGRASGIPSTLEDVDSTMPDNAARDAAIRDAARAADERARASDAASKRFGPPTLQSPNDGALPSSPAASVGGAVVDAILPSAAFARPEPPPTTPTHGGEPPPLLGTAGLHPQPLVRANAGGFVGGAVATGRATGAPGPGPTPGGPPAPWTGGPQQHHGLGRTGGPGAGSAPPYFPQTAGIGAMGSGAPGAYLGSQAPSAPTSAPAGLPRQAKSSAPAIFILLASVVAVFVLAVAGFALLMHARGGHLSLPTGPPPGSAPTKTTK